jgi:outer membrane protein OmpA-like peptidoglycan-associated protein
LLHLLRSGAVQAKLTVNQPGDCYEQEADQVAESVIRMPEPRNAAEMGTLGATPVPALQRMCSECEEEQHGSPPPVQRLCSECGHKKPKDEANLQAKKISGHTPEVTPAIQGQIGAIRSGGQPLSEPVRAFFEPRFGHDFGNVRVHTSQVAGDTASSINALAYTSGNDIVFAAGQYAPETEPGRRLLAHELVHTIQQSHIAASIQRFGDSTKAASCPVATSSPGSTSTVTIESLFPNVGTALTPEQKAAIDNFIVSWRAFGGSTEVRVDGYASPPGTDSLNWRLSCERAQAVVAELEKPSSGVPGIPASQVSLFAHGKTSEFSKPSGADTDGPNRRATISSPSFIPPPAPRVPTTPSCPVVPNATPATCPSRHTAYCAAGTCFPANRWLPCACTASEQVCDAVDAFSGTGVKGTLLDTCVPLDLPDLSTLRRLKAKATWFLSTNRCIWGHWRSALDALHDPTLPMPSSVTPEWSAAITICRASGVNSKACCEAHVVAEQNAIDHCRPYDSKVFGRLPTDVPGSPSCSYIVAQFAPSPAFTGDFGKVADRIKYGKSRCCS